MPLKVDGGEFLNTNEINESAKSEIFFGVMSDISDSELKWVQLHQMFDK